MGSTTSIPTDESEEQDKSHPNRRLSQDEAFRKSAAIVDAYETRSDYKLPQSPMKPTKYLNLRDSSSIPPDVAYLMDGGPEGDHIPDDTPSQEALLLEKRHLCVWGYFVAIIVLFLIVVIFCILSFYFEMVGYLADKEWNEILMGRSTFRSVVKDDDYFVGKTFLQSYEIVPKTLDGSHVQHHLKRCQRKELSVLIIIVICALGVLGHPIALAYLAYKKEKRLFNVTKFGLLGVGLFLSTIFLTMSILVKIPNGFVGLRIDLEEKVGVVDVKHYHKKTYHGHGESKHSQQHIESCDVDENAQNRDELRRLLSVMKMCAYHYVQMNRRDPCLKDPIPSHLVFSIAGNVKNYTRNDLEMLGICPNDTPKIHALFLNLTSAICCWIIMGMGSHLKILLKERSLRRKIRKTLIGMSDAYNAKTQKYDPRRIPSRDNVPRQSSPTAINFSKLLASKKRSTKIEHEHVETEEEPLVPSFGLICSPTASLTDTKNPQSPAIKMRKHRSSSVIRIYTASQQSIMTVAPNFVIHPTISIPNNKKRRNSIWFNYS